LNAAASGELGTDAGLLSHAQALLDAMPASLVFQRFHSELFGLDRYRSIEKDATAFPKFTATLPADLMQADTLFFDSIFSHGQGLRELLQSSAAFVNEATASFNATLRDPDIIHRGVDINRRVLGAPNLAPPAGVVIPALPTPVPGQTNRQRVNAHTGAGTCGASCHGTFINPIGFAFENFDALGQVRTTDNGKPIDTTSEYDFTDGKKAFSGAPELMQIMAEETQTHGSYAGHLAEFALARDIDETDRPFVKALQQASMAPSSSIKQIVLSVIQSPSFRTRGAQ
jgi:hypothetical protein